MWVAGKWTAGKIRWTSDLSAWHTRPGAQAYAYNFGDPYDPATGANPPVFKPPREGDPVSIGAVAVTKDGTVWFASDPLSSRDPNYGLASFDGKSFNYFPLRAAGVSRARDLIALPDGRLAIASPAGLSLWDPSSGKTTLVSGTAALPSDVHVVRAQQGRQGWILNGDGDLARVSGSVRELPRHRPVRIDRGGLHLIGVDLV